MLFTHQHRDHFEADLALTYMKNNKNCNLIGPQQVVDQLSESEGYKEITERIHSITPPFGHSEHTNIHGIKLLVLRFQHSSYFVTDEQTGKEVDRHKNIHNLGFMINLGNYKILHIGDSFLQNIDEYKVYRLDREKIDIAFLLFDPARIEAVKNYIKPKNIIMMHLPKDKKMFFDLRDTYHSSLAPTTIFTEELERKDFNK